MEAVQRRDGGDVARYVIGAEVPSRTGNQRQIALSPSPKSIVEPMLSSRSLHLCLGPSYVLGGLSTTWPNGASDTRGF